MFGYNIIKILGEGNYGTIYLGINEETGEKVAIKKVSAEAGKKEADISQKMIDLKLSHPNLVKILSIKIFGRYYFIIMELVEGITLKSYVKSQTQISFDILWGISSGVAYLHQHNIAHRDLKPDNIIMKGEVPVIIDFGFGCINDKTSKLHCYGSAGTPIYMDPQLLRSGVPDYFKADIYSMGSIFYFILSKKLPFPAKNIDELNQKKYRNIVKPLNTPFPSIDNLIYRMINFNPELRPSIDDIINMLRKWVESFTIYNKQEKVIVRKRDEALVRKVYNPITNETSLILLENDHVKFVKKDSVFTVYPGPS